MGLGNDYEEPEIVEYERNKREVADQGEGVSGKGGRDGDLDSENESNNEEEDELEDDLDEADMWRVEG